MPPPKTDVLKVFVSSLFSSNVEFCDPCWSKWHSKGTLQSHIKKQLLLQETTIEAVQEDLTVSSKLPLYCYGHVLL